jgi:AcrR family transcriptional regulator
MSARRPYRSRAREDQARATRRRIVDAGAALFVERGYAATTIDAIAERAGVGRKTVFTSVGGKVGVLKLAFDWALAGDDEPVAIGDRPEVRAMLASDDPAALLDPWLAMNAAIAARVAALHHAIVVAADGDAEAAELLSSLDAQRAEGALVVATRLGELGGLRPGLPPAEAAAVLDVLIDPVAYRRLVELHGLAPAAYLGHLQRMAAAALR